VSAEPSAAVDAGAAGPAGLLGWVERAGNRVPNPAILFLALIVLVIAASQILDWADVGVTQQVAEPPAAQVETHTGGASPAIDSYDPRDASANEGDYAIRTEHVEAKGLLTGDGIRFMFTQLVANFLGFAAVGVILVAMVGVGVAEYSGLVGALIRKLVAISSPASLTYIIVFVGIVSSVASDAGYLVLVPLAAAAFISVGRHPLAGIAAAFGAVSAAFAVNILLTPADGVVTDITNEAAQLVDPAVHLDLVANLWLGSPRRSSSPSSSRWSRRGWSSRGSGRGTPRAPTPRSSPARRARRSTPPTRPRACGGRSTRSSRSCSSCSR
jgi:aminobenzoyl-glutamate transport protein